MYYQDDEIYYPRYNFDGLLYSFFMVFQVLTLENWNNAFYDCWRATSQPMAMGYFYAVIFIGNYMLLNLFIAILLGNFEGLVNMTKEAQRKQDEANALTETASMSQDEKGKTRLQKFHPLAMLKSSWKVSCACACV
jgi:hypothetical protein